MSISFQFLYRRLSMLWSDRRQLLTVVSLLIAYSLAFLNCTSERKLTNKLRETTYPVAGFRTDVPDRVLDSRRPEPRWVTVDDTVFPALVARSDSVLSIRIDDLNATSIEGGIGLLNLDGVANADRPRTTRVTFRIRVHKTSDDPGSVVWMQSLSDSEAGLPVTEPINVTLHEPRSEVRFVTFEARYAELGSDRPSAGWINPVVKGSRPASPLRVKQPWNVVIITSDTTRRDSLSSYGGSAQTPRLAELASEGLIFDNALSVAFGTTPSHSSLLTGSHAALHGVYDNQTILSEDQLTMAEVLRAHGYTTAAFVSARPVARGLGLAQGFDLFDDLFLEGGGIGGIYARHERRAGTTTSRFLDWLELEGPRPFFAWIHYFDPHQPYAPPPKIADNRLEEPPAISGVFRKENGELNYLKAPELLAEAPEMFDAVVQAAKQRYALELEYLDSQVGLVLDRLRSTGEATRTLVVFVADHGENFAEHRSALAFDHATVLDPVSRIPLIIRLPATDASGERTNALVSNADIAPTVLEMLGVGVPEEWSGRSFAHLLRGTPSRPFLRSVILEGAHQHEIGVRTDRWLYRQITPEFRAADDVRRYLGYAENSFVEIYDFEDDTEGIPVDPGDCPDFERLQTAARRFLASKRKVATESLTGENHRQGLRALGYIE